MLDPKKIIATIESAMQQATQAQAGLQSSFMSTVPSMAVEGPGNAAGVMSAIAQACQDMAAKMEGTRQVMDADVAAHQAAQAAQQPADFDVTARPVRPPT
jgi:hypothetical protein